MAIYNIKIISKLSCTSTLRSSNLVGAVSQNFRHKPLQVGLLSSKTHFAQLQDKGIWFFNLLSITNEYNFLNVSLTSLVIYMSSFYVIFTCCESSCLSVRC